MINMCSLCDFLHGNLSVVPITKVELKVELEQDWKLLVRFFVYL